MTTNPFHRAPEPFERSTNAPSARLPHRASPVKGIARGMGKPTLAARGHLSPRGIAGKAGEVVFVGVRL